MQANITQSKQRHYRSPTVPLIALNRPFHWQMRGRTIRCRVKEEEWREEEGIGRQSDIYMWSGQSTMRIKIMNFKKIGLNFDRNLNMPGSRNNSWLIHPLFPRDWSPRKSWLQARTTLHWSTHFEYNQFSSQALCYAVSISSLFKTLKTWNCFLFSRFADSSEIWSTFSQIRPIWKVINR